MSKNNFLIYTYAIKNKFSYKITQNKLTVIDRVTKDEWTYGFVGLLKKRTKDRLVYEKMKEMVKEKEMKAQIDKTVKKGFKKGGESWKKIKRKKLLINL